MGVAPGIPVAQAAPMAQTHELTLHNAASLEDVFAPISAPRPPGQDSEDTLMDARRLPGTPGVAEDGPLSA